MKKGFLLVFTLLLALLACNTTLPQTAPTTGATPTQTVAATLELPQGQTHLPLSEADVPRVKVEDAKTALDSGKAVIVDVRSTEAYAAGHVTGAISIPLAEFENNIANVKLDKNQWIITYCT